AFRRIGRVSNSAPFESGIRMALGGRRLGAVSLTREATIGRLLPVCFGSHTLQQDLCSEIRRREESENAKRRPRTQSDPDTCPRVLRLRPWLSTPQEPVCRARTQDRASTAELFCHHRTRWWPWLEPLCNALFVISCRSSEHCQYRIDRKTGAAQAIAEPAM